MNWRDDSGDYLSASNRSDWLIKKLDWLPKWARILDIGCNAGRDLRALYNTGYYNLTGIDLNDSILSIPWPVSIVRADISFIKNFGHESFDLVTMIAVAEHIHNEDCLKYISNISRHWIVTVSAEALCGDNYHPWDYSRLFMPFELAKKEIVPPSIFGLDKQYFYRLYRK